MQFTKEYPVARKQLVQWIKEVGVVHSLKYSQNMLSLPPSSSGYKTSEYIPKKDNTLQVLGLRRMHVAK